MKIVVSANCGASFTTVWARGGPGLATAGSSTDYYTAPAPGDWIKQKVSIGQNLFGGGQVIVGFRNVNDFGNVMWIDNINIDMKPRKDMQAISINRPNLTECAPPFAPSLTVRNNGGETVTGFKTGYILNGGTPFIQVHNISLTTGATATVTFPNINPPAGNNTLRLFVTDPITPSGGPDNTPANDTLTRTFLVPVTLPNVVEGFEGTTFVPANWALRNPNNNVTWIRRTPGKTSDYSAFIDNYNNNTATQSDIMQAPPVNTVGADGVNISFDLAHKDYPGSFDTLRVLVSTDCGASFTRVYGKSGPALATAGSSIDDYTDPLQTDWRRETISLGSAYTGGNLIVQFDNRNDFGNNIFIDNVNIAPVFKRDIELLSVTPDVVCAPAFSPIVTIRNRGTETITGYKISYTVNGGAAVLTTVTGANIAPNATATVPLTAGTLGAGANTIKVYSFEPVTASGTGDQYTLNDTLSKISYLAGSVAAPGSIVETFEGNFLPAGWALSNPDNSITWQKAGVGKNSTASAYIRNFIYYATGQKDGLYTPVLNFTGVDSINVSFDLSATTRNLQAPFDTLEVLATRDCGNTFTSVYKKGGSQLQTINDPNYPQSVEYAPNGAHLWRTERLDLSSLGANGPLQLVFRNINYNQNNIYIDNVNFRTVTLPPRLKAEGFIVTPTPFAERFNLWFVQTPSDLRYITVYNSSGQLIWNKAYGNGSTTNVISVDLTGKSAGIYILYLGFSDKSRDKQVRILKTD